MIDRVLGSEPGRESASEDHDRKNFLEKAHETPSNRLRGWVNARTRRRGNGQDWLAISLYAAMNEIKAFRLDSQGLPVEIDYDRLNFYTQMTIIST